VACPCGEGKGRATGAGAGAATGGGAATAGAAATTDGDVEAGTFCFRRGKSIAGSPFQSFHERVTTGGTGGRPWKATSNMARFTSLPGRTFSSVPRTRSNCATSMALAIVSLDAAEKK